MQVAGGRVRRQSPGLAPQAAEEHDARQRWRRQPLPQRRDEARAETHQLVEGDDQGAFWRRLESRWRDDNRARRPAASRQLKRDPTAERIADHCGRVQAEAVQLGFDRIGQPGRGRSGASGQPRAFAEAGEIDRNHLVAALKGVEHWLPGAPAEPKPVHQNERLPATAAVARQRRHAAAVGASGTCFGHVLLPRLGFRWLRSSSSCSSVARSTSRPHGRRVARSLHRPLHVGAVELTGGAFRRVSVHVRRLCGRRRGPCGRARRRGPP